MKRSGKNYLIVFCAKVLIVCGVLISPGCSGMGNLAISAAGNVIGSIVAEEIKEKRKEIKEKNNGEKSP